MESTHGHPRDLPNRRPGAAGGGWSEWFEGLTITLGDSGETILAGPLADQSALHGILIKIRDLGLPLLALARIAPAGGQDSKLLPPEDAACDG